MIAFQNDPARPGTYSHIAIYVGGGQIIAAPHTGDVVKIQPVTIPYWTGATTLSSPPDRNWTCSPYRRTREAWLAATAAIVDGLRDQPHPARDA